MLELDHITVTQDAFSLAANLRFEARITALLGPSGAGKSTLLNVIAGFTTPAAGRILWQGTDITAHPPARRPVSILFQDNNLFPHLNVEQNLLLALPRTIGDAPQLIADALARVDLAGTQTRKPAQLSGGQQSRVALARVLLQARPVILLDEPFAALGPALKKDMLDLVAAVVAERDMRALMVSHDPQDAVRIADSAAVVADGVVTAPMNTTQLLANPPAPLSAYLGR